MVGAAPLITLAAVVAGASLVIVFYRTTTTKKEEDAEENDEDDEELLDLESTNLMMMAPAISVLTFHCISSGDAAFAATEAHLRRRLTAVVALNPWLCGRLTRRRSKMRVHVVYPRHVTSLPPACLQVTHDDQLNEGLGYAALTARVAQLAVKDGNGCVNARRRNEPLFRVTLVRTGPTTLALFFSVSHVLVDGQAFYALYGMLGVDGVPAALVVKRHHAFSRDLAALMGGTNDTLQWFTSPGAALGIVGTLVFAPPARVLVQPVSASFIARHKAEHGNAPGFVSTNDVLTSWLLRAAGSDVGLMAMNFRGRVADLTPQHAGNYEALLGYQRGDVCSAADIRASIAGPPFRRVHAAVPFPRSLLASARARVGLVSSWASLYVDAALPGCAQTYHVPYFEASQIPLRDIFILFRPDRASLSVLALTRSLDTATLAQLEE